MNHTRALGACRGIRPRRRGFTLIEVLVVVGIIGLLIGILMPSLGRARHQAKSTTCLSHLRQVGIGLIMYVQQNRDFYPVNSNPKVAGKPRMRWADFLQRFLRDTEAFDCPSLTDQEIPNMRKPWASTVRPDGTEDTNTRYYGGYGYNFQYLGNGRFGPGAVKSEWRRTFHATRIVAPSRTLAVADTRGTRNGVATNLYGQGGEGVYIVDPPLGSLDLGSKGSRHKLNAVAGNDWYAGSGEEDLVRSSPAPRHLGRVAIAFVDGHSEPLTPAVLDGRASGGTGDNRYYNGLYRHDLR